MLNILTVQFCLVQFPITMNKSFNLSICHRYIDIYINAYVDTHNFVLIVHPGNDTKCRTKSSQMGKKIYKLLKER